MLKRFSLALLALLLLAPLYGVSHAASCLTITRTLSRGAHGQDVTYLQQYLASQNLLSTDSATGYYGGMTEKAVQAWQTIHGPVSSGTPETTGFGMVGAKTRLLLCAVTQAQSVPVTPTPTTPPAIVSPVISAPTTTPPAFLAPTNPLQTTSALSVPAQNGVGPVPQIQSFLANPSVINASGEKVTLTWTVFQAASCDVAASSTSVASGLAASYSTVVTPSASTVYTLTCKGVGDGSTSTPATATATRSVRVLYPLPTCSVSLDRSSYVIGDTIRLSWTSTDTDHGIWSHQMGDAITLPWGNTDQSGFYFIRANNMASQLATLTVFGQGGTGTCSATITVTAPTSLSKDVLSQFAAVAQTLSAILEKLKD